MATMGTALFTGQYRTEARARIFRGAAGVPPAGWFGRVSPARHWPGDFPLVLPCGRMSKILSFYPTCCIYEMQGVTPDS